MSNQRKSVLFNFGIGVAGRSIAQLLSFFVFVYLARVLEPSGYGEISLGIAIVSYFGLIVSFGLSTVGTREVASSPSSIQSSVNRIVSLRICLALIAFLLLSAYVLFFVENFQFMLLLMLYGLGLFSSALLIDWVFVGLENLRTVAIAQILSNIIIALLMFGLVKNADNILVIPIGFFLGSLIGCAYLLFTYGRHFQLKLLVDWSEFRVLMILAAPFAVRGILEQFYENLDMILLGYLGGAKEVGYYSVAFKLIIASSSLIAVYIQSTFPVMIRLFETDRSAIGAFLRLNVNRTLYVMTPILFGGVMLSSELMETLFGSLYLQAAMPFSWLLFYLFFMALSIALANFLLAAREDRTYLMTLIWGVLVNVVLNFLLIPVWLSSGAALAMVAAEVVIVAFLWIRVKRLHCESLYSRRLLAAALICSGLMDVVIYAVQQIGQIHVGFLIVIGATFYFAVSWPGCGNLIGKVSKE